MSCILDLKVVPGAKKKRWVRTDAGELKCYVTAQAVDGKANKAVIDALSDDLKIAKSKIKILTGHTARHKRIEIESAISVPEILKILGLDFVQSSLFDE